MRAHSSRNRSRGGQARKPAKNEASRIEGCEIRDLSRVEMRLASAPLAVKSRFSRGFWISTLIRYHYPGRERLLYPQGRFEVQRFRPNIVVEPVGSEQSFRENAWIGHTLAIGDEVRLRITGPCGRCVMTTLAQGDLPKDSGILRTAVQHNQGNVGVYAAVVRGGTIRRGDRVRLGA